MYHMVRTTVDPNNGWLSVFFSISSFNFEFIFNINMLSPLKLFHLSKNFVLVESSSSFQPTLSSLKMSFPNPTLELQVGSLDSTSRIF